MRFALCVFMLLLTVTSRPALAGGEWKDCLLSHAEAVTRMLFFRHTDFAYVVDPGNISLCEYRKVKEGTMASVVLERFSPNGNLEREMLTPILSRIAVEYDYRVAGRPLLPPLAERRPTVRSPYVHEIIPENGGKRFTLLTGPLVSYKGRVHRLVMVFRGSPLTDRELLRLLREAITRFSV